MEIGKETTSYLPSEKNVALIAEVKKFPSLYDTSDPDYYSLAERNKAWLQVAENCRLPADQCHLRWKSLRKRYAKERRKLPEVVRGLYKPWALYPKMAFLGSINPDARRKVKHTSDKKIKCLPDNFHKNISEDDMLIVGENNEIVRTCKSSDVSEEDEYIYETLDDPDSVLEIMNSKSLPKVKSTAIRSGKVIRPPPAVPSRVGGSGRIRKLTPKMQNSFIAKKLKQAQQIMQQTNNNSNVMNSKSTAAAANISKNCVVKLDKVQTTRHVATVNPNNIKEETPEISKSHSLLKKTNAVRKEQVSPSKENSTFKVVKLKGRNPLIFSPEQLPDIQSLLKSEALSNKDQNKSQEQSPVIKVKTVDNLNNMSNSSTSSENSNLDIIHSVGLMRKKPKEKQVKTDKVRNQSYSNAYSWNRPDAKLAKQATLEKSQPQPDSQTNDFEIEEAWNDIKQENIEEAYWDQPHDSYLPLEPMVMMETPESGVVGSNNTMYNQRLAEAKMELILHQKRLMDEQHKKTMEYMKREHDLKMTLLKAEIDLKRKQLNIML